MKKQISEDLERAIQYNETTFNLEDIISVEAEMPGDYDGFSWCWILQIKERGYLLLRGSCDYTGWDCVSSVSELGFFDEAIDAALASCEIQSETPTRAISSELVHQVKTGETFSLTVKTWEIS